MVVAVVLSQFRFFFFFFSLNPVAKGWQEQDRDFRFVVDRGRGVQGLIGRFNLPILEKNLFLINIKHENEVVMPQLRRS